MPQRFEGFLGPTSNGSLLGLMEGKQQDDFPSEFCEHRVLCAEKDICNFD